MSAQVSTRWTAREQECLQATRRALLFQLNETTYAISVEYVDKVIELQDVTPVPGSPSWVAGIVVHDLLPYPLIDPRVLLQSRISGSGALNRAVVIKSAHGNVLIGVEQLVTISDLTVRPRVKVTRQEFPAPLIEYICKSDNSLVGVISMPDFLKAADAENKESTAGQSH